MTAGPLVVVGDALLDVDLDGAVTRRCPDAPAPVLDVGPGGERVRPGGAALAAVLATADVEGPVHLVTALGDRGTDPATGALLDALGPRVHAWPRPWTGTVPTKTRLRDGATVLARVDRGGLHPRTAEPHEVADILALLDGACAVLVCDYGRGMTTDPVVRSAVARATDRVPVVWDPHPRGAPPVPGVGVVCPNHDEASAWAPGHAPGDAAAALRRRWGAEAVAVTLGAAGALLGDTTHPLLDPLPDAPDTCGAGDRFAAALVSALARGADRTAAVPEAVERAGDYVRAGGAAALRPDSRGGWLVPGATPETAPLPLLEGARR